MKFLFASLAAAALRAGARAFSANEAQDYMPVTEC